MKPFDRLEDAQPHGAALDVADGEQRVRLLRGSHWRVGAVLPWTLEQGLGAAFATDVKAAWAVCYGMLPGV